MSTVFSPTYSMLDGALVQDPLLERLSRAFHSEANKQKIDEVARHYLGQEEAIQTEEAIRFVARHANEKKPTEELLRLDRFLHRDDKKFQIEANKADFNRWTRWKFDENYFFDFYDFVQYLLTTPLGGQTKIFNQPFEPNDEGQPCIVVQLNEDEDPALFTLEDLMATFEVRYSEEYNQSFIHRKETDQIYTYLDNGNGLQPLNPYEIGEKLKPVTRLNDDDFERTLEAAQKYNRAETEKSKNEDRTFILQIVSSYIDKGPNFNCVEVAYKKKHPWVRIICGADNDELGTKKGDVYDLGYGWKNPSILPAALGEGQFRLVDLWNYMVPKRRIVTNIAMTQAEAHEIYDFVKNRQELAEEGIIPIPFSFFRHNCTAFVDAVLKKLGIDCGAKLSPSQLIAELSPDWMRAIGRFFQWLASPGVSISSAIYERLPACLQAVADLIKRIHDRFLDAVSSIPMGAGSFALGGFIGGHHYGFEEEINNAIHDNFLTTRNYHYFLPGMLQRWQLEQGEATCIYESEVKLCVVPPPA